MHREPPRNLHDIPPQEAAVIGLIDVAIEEQQKIIDAFQLEAEEFVLRREMLLGALAESKTRIDQGFDMVYQAPKGVSTEHSVALAIRALDTEERELCRVRFRLRDEVLDLLQELQPFELADEALRNLRALRESLTNRPFLVEAILPHVHRVVTLAKERSPIKIRTDCTITELIDCLGSGILAG